jgi:hypothetical protein
MPMIEGFAEEEFKVQRGSAQHRSFPKPVVVKNELKKWRKEGFANDDGGYSCQSHGEQSCMYTAQGNFICQGK